jgi:hypothetical protein
MNVNDLYKRYVELFPQVKVFDYTVGLTTNEINTLRNEIKEIDNKGNNNKSTIKTNNK